MSGGAGRKRDEEPRSATDVRIRSAADALEGLAAVAAIWLVMLAAHTLPVATESITRHVSRGVTHLPRVLVVVFAVLDALAVIGLLVSIGVSIARRRPRDGINALVAATAAGLVAVGSVAAWHTFHGGVATAMLHGTDGSTFVRDGIIVALVSGSDTVRYTGWGRYCVLVVGGLLLSGLALGELTLFGGVVATLGGWAMGLFTRWVLRTTVRRPSIESLVRGLDEAGLEVRSLERSSPESPELYGTLADGRQILLKAAGREMHASAVLRQLWARVRLRGAAIGPQLLTKRSALETEALASMMAASTGVLAPKVLLLAHFEPGTLVLALEHRDGPALDEKADDAQLQELFSGLHRLHEVGVAHRDLRAENLVYATDAAGERASVGFRSLASAAVGAGELVRRLDLVQLLTSVAGLVGAQRAVEALRAGYAAVDENAVAAILQPVALTGWGWTRMRAARETLAELRREMIGEHHEEVAETRIERFRWRTVVSAVAITIAAFVLVGQLSRVNLVGALQRANWAWFLVALIGSAISYVGSSINLLAFVPKRVSVLKGALVELGGAFLGLVTPASVGRVAVNGRFLHREGVDAATTAAAVGLSQLVNFITTLVLLVVAALLTGTGAGHLKIVPSPRLLGVLAGLVVLSAVLITLVPYTKNLFWNRLWPRIRGAWPQLLQVLSQPLRLIVGVGGNLLLTASYVLALIATLHAVGAHPPIIATAAVFMAGNTVGAAAPTPGGIGAVEAVMAAGLTAVGIPAHEAVPAVLLFRLATFWLPILPSWPLFIVLQRRRIL